MVLLYDGFGSQKAARLSGRVLEDRGFDRPRKGESTWARARRSYRLLESDEIPHARVVVRVLGKRHTVEADEEGLFRLELPGPLPVGVHRIGARLLGKRRHRVIQGRLSVWPARGGVAIISDIDDTVLDSNVRRKGRLLWRTLTGNVHRMKAYDGAAKLFSELHRRGCPIVFVSGSPINLYPRLRGFFELRGFPRAPLLLKNLGVAKGSDSLFEQRKYKLRRLEQVRRLLPGYRFVLLGDSGESDPEIYAEIKRRWRDRVLAILIHRITDEAAEAVRFSGQNIFTSYRAARRVLVRLALPSEGAAAEGRR